MTTVTRFAPSPTGFLHIGGARTALFCFLQARHDQGKMILRIEDTDRERSTDEAVQAILDGMEWLGLAADEGPYYQTQRMPRYKEVLKQWLKAGKAYHCYCSKERIETLKDAQEAAGETRKYDGHCRDLKKTPEKAPEPTIRFRTPQQGSIAFTDRVQGDMSFENTQLDDLVIARSDGSPTYNFTVVVDDYDMGVTEVIRGDDHLNNTPRQLHMYAALDATPPSFAHVPMILGSDGKKLSKRHGALSVMQYRDDGYLPHAVLNYLVRLGWSHGDQEIFSMDEMIQLFDILDANKAPSRLDLDKLAWINQHYFRSLNAEEISPHLKWHFNHLDIDLTEGPDLADLIFVQKDRHNNLHDIAKDSAIYYHDFEEFDPNAAKKHLRGAAIESLNSIYQRLSEVDNWTAESLHDAVTDVAQSLELKMGKVAQPLRVALAGCAISPSIDLTLWLTGKKRSLARIQTALAFIEARMAQ